MRKLREHFLLGLDQDPNPKKKSQSPPAEGNEYVNMSLEALEEMLKNYEREKGSKKHILPHKFQKEDIENQLKIVRRREYYYKKVKNEA